MCRRNLKYFLEKRYLGRNLDIKNSPKLSLLQSEMALSHDLLAL